MPLRTLRALTSKAVSMRGSLMRAGIFMLTWAFLPWWLFVLVAFFLYFAPPSQARTTLAPFLALLVLCLAQPAGWFSAVIFGALFWYTLLIKELYIIDRKSASEMLALALIFLLFRAFYLDLGSYGWSALAAVCALGAAALSASLVTGFMGRFSPDIAPAPAASPLPQAAQTPLRRVIALTIFLLVFQFLIIGLFLQLDFIYQSTVVFLFGALVVELLSSYLFGTFSRGRLLTTASVIFALLVLVLGSARWGL